MLVVTSMVSRWVATQLKVQAISSSISSNSSHHRIITSRIKPIRGRRRMLEVGGTSHKEDSNSRVIKEEAIIIGSMEWAGVDGEES